jgi:hypothetical protein
MSSQMLFCKVSFFFFMLFNPRFSVAHTTPLVSLASCLFQDCILRCAKLTARARSSLLRCGPRSPSTPAPTPLCLRPRRPSVPRHGAARAHSCASRPRPHRAPAIGRLGAGGDPEEARHIAADFADGTLQGWMRWLGAGPSLMAAVAHDWVRGRLSWLPSLMTGCGAVSHGWVRGRRSCAARTRRPPSPVPAVLRPGGTRNLPNPHPHACFLSASCSAGESLCRGSSSCHPVERALHS